MKMNERITRTMHKHTLGMILIDHGHPKTEADFLQDIMMCNLTETSERAAGSFQPRRRAS